MRNDDFSPPRPWILRSLWVGLFALLAMPTPVLAQQVLLDAGVQAGELTVYPTLGTGYEASDEYYYVHSEARLARNESGDPEFSFLRFVDVVRPEAGEDAQREGEGGGIVHAVVQLAVEESTLREAERELQRLRPGARIVGPVVYRSGTFGLVSSFQQEDGDWTRRVVGLGKAPVLEGSRAAVSIRLTKEGAQILWESFRMVEPDISFRFEMEVAGLRAPTRALLEADWDRIYQSQAFQVGVAGTFLAGEISGEFDALRQEGAIRVVQVGEDDDFEKAIDVAYGKLLKIMFEPVEASDLPQLEQMAAQAGQPSVLDRASELLSSARAEARERNQQLAAATGGTRTSPGGRGGSASSSASAGSEAEESRDPSERAGGESAAGDGRAAGSGGPDAASPDRPDRRATLAVVTVQTLQELQSRLESHVQDLREIAAAWQDEVAVAAELNAEDEEAASRRARTMRQKLAWTEEQLEGASQQASQFAEMMNQAQERAEELEAGEARMEPDEREARLRMQESLRQTGRWGYITYTDYWVEYYRLKKRYEGAAGRWERKASGLATERQNAEVEAAALAAATREELESAERLLSRNAERIEAARARARELSQGQEGAGAASGSVDPRVQQLASLRADAVYLQFRLETFLAYSDALRTYSVEHGDLTEEQADQIAFYRDPPLEELQTRGLELEANMREMERLERELGLDAVAGRPTGAPRYSQAQEPTTPAEESQAIADAEERGPAPGPVDPGGNDESGPGGTTADAERVREPSFAVVGALQLRRTRQSGTFRLDLNKYSPDTQVLPFTSNVGDLTRYLDDPEFFREVNLDQPLFRQRAVSFRLAGVDAQDFGQLVNFVHVQLRRGDATREELTVDAAEFNEAGNDFPLVYGFSGQESRDEWLRYEYRTVWSFVSGLEVEQPWERSDTGAVALAPPYQRREVEVTANPDDLREAGARVVTVRLYYGEGDDERFSEVVLIPSREVYAGTAEVILPAGDPEFEYEMLWQLRGGEERNSGRLSSSSSILFVDQVPGQ